jgi:hypothetical protein
VNNAAVFNQKYCIILIIRIVIRSIDMGTDVGTYFEAYLATELQAKCETDFRHILGQM